MHYYQFNIGDYAKSTLHLSMMEDLAYRRLLDRYYDTEKPLEADVEKLCRFIRMTNQKKETQQVLSEFFTLTKKGWIQKRVQKELAAYSLKADTARANGKRGGRPKKTQPVSSGLPVETQEKAKQEPLTINQEPLNKSNKTLGQNEFDHAFDSFWSSGIRKLNKKKAKSVFTNILKKQADKTGFVQMLIDDVQARININQLGFTEMHPTTYLNGERWTDDKVITNETNNRHAQQPKPSAGDRVRQAIEREANRQGAGSYQPAMGTASGNIRGGVHNPVRGSTEPQLEGFIEGNFTRTD